MKYFSLSICLLLLLLLCAPMCCAKDRDALSENDILLIEKALESTAPNAHFSALVSLASVIINRYRSPIYPDSVLTVIEGSKLLKIDHSVIPTERSRTAVKYAMLGSSPIKDATGFFLSDGVSVPSAAEYIVIENWYFYTE